MSEIHEGRRSLRLIKTAFRQTRLRIKARFLPNRIKEDSESDSEGRGRETRAGRQPLIRRETSTVFHEKAASIIRIQSSSSLAPQYFKQKRLRSSDLARLLTSTMQIFTLS